jgi:CspA family cold shock protein
VPGGLVKWFNEASGYGFIVPDEGETDLFVRRGSMSADAGVRLSEGERVQFEAREGGMGSEAINVLPLAASEECAHRAPRGADAAVAKARASLVGHEAG